MKTVILAEKPSQAKAYADSFAQAKKGNGCYQISDPLFNGETVITHGLGHLVTLATPDKYDAKYKRWAMKYLPIFPETYQYIVPYAKRAQFKIVKALLEQADVIIVATDADREGENIAWSIMKQAKIDVKHKQIYRLWINSLEKAAIRAGFSNLQPGWDFYPKYQEAQTREISDWLVGMNASPLFSLLLRKYGVKGTFSVGRVQTPTLALVNQRQLEIENFIPTAYQVLAGKVQAPNVDAFNAHLNPEVRFLTPTDLSGFMKKHAIEFGDNNGRVIESTVTPKTQPSPRLFALSTLQTQANKLFHASAAATLAAAQHLYEAKFLTYPRTDTSFITPAEFAYLNEYTDQYQAAIGTNIKLPNQQPNKRYVDASKVQEHHAIIPTRTIPTSKKIASLPPLERNIYQLVVKTTLAMFATPYGYDETSVLTQVGQATFKATGKVTTNLGWHELLAVKVSKNEMTKVVPAVPVGTAVVVTVTSVDKMTQAPVPYTEGTLITAMKNAGKLVEDADEQAILKATEGLGTEATRAGIIDKLKVKKYIVVKKNEVFVTELGQVLCKIVATQPLLVSPTMTAKWEVALAQIGQEKRSQANFLQQIKQFLTTIIEETPKKLAADEDLQAQLHKHQTPTKVNEIYGQCPNCKNGNIIDRGKFYGCTNYQNTPQCRYSLPKSLSGKVLPKTAIKALITTGKTATIRGFKSKNGRTFTAQLVMVDEKIKFIFENK